MTRRWWVAGCSAVAAVGLVCVLVACTSQSAAQPRSTVPTARTTATSTSSVAASAPPKACSEVAAASDVDSIVGHQLVGSMVQIVGVPQPSINRTGRLDCYYGVPPGKPATAGVVSVGIASYTDVQTAQHRTTLTVHNDRDAGASTSAVRVGDENAVLVASATSQELVLSRDRITVLISADNGVLPSGKVGPELVLLAQRALAALP